jgi:hypothetical protein
MQLIKNTAETAARSELQLKSTKNRASYRNQPELEDCARHTALFRENNDSQQWWNTGQPVSDRCGI